FRPTVGVSSKKSSRQDQKSAPAVSNWLAAADGARSLPDTTGVSMQAAITRYENARRTPNVGAGFTTLTSPIAAKFLASAGLRHELVRRVSANPFLFLAARRGAPFASASL